MKICLLVSGGLGLEALKKLYSEHSLTCVFTDSKSDSIIDFCQQQGIQLMKGNPRNGKFDAMLGSIDADIMLSVNYLFIVPPSFLQLAKKYSINIHGSLLPRYRGRTPHVWSIINNEKNAGITAHLMDEGCDTGDILEQIVIPIDPSDTGADLLRKYNEKYPVLIDSIMDKISSNTLHIVKQDHSKATYFGKRTQEDGEIQWHWQRERIYNWIRAQARPYPGAFTYCDDTQIVIHKSAFSDEGFSYEMENGRILKVTEDSLIIKTPNGALEISDLEFDTEVSFAEGMVFNSKITA